MYDTLSLTIKELNKHKLQELTAIEKGGRLVYHLKNLRVIKGYDNYFLHGSVAKYINDTNIYSFTPQEYKEALQDIESALDTDLHKALILRVDVGLNLFSKNDILDAFGACNDSRVVRDERTRNNKIESILYSSHSFEFEIYDKGLESQTDMQGLYRLEYRIKKRQALQRIFDGDINPYMLLNPDVKDTLKQRFREFYNSIQMNDTTIHINKSLTRRFDDVTLKDVKNVLASLWILENKQRFRELKKYLPKDLNVNRLKRELQDLKPPFYRVCSTADEIEKSIKLWENMA